MPPSCPHAVFTPEDCLAVGGQVYTAAHLSSSLDGLQMQEAFPDISNEDVKADTYHLLCRIFTDLDEISMENRVIREALRPTALAISTSAYLEALDVNMAYSHPAPSAVGTAKSTKSSKSSKSTKPSYFSVVRPRSTLTILETPIHKLKCADLRPYTSFNTALSSILCFSRFV
jgi:hypothetical protein